MVKQRSKKILVHPYKIKSITKKAVNQTTIKTQISQETNIHNFTQTKFLGTNFGEVQNVV
jgi:hypothetical protein